MCMIHFDICPFFDICSKSGLITSKEQKGAVLTFSKVKGGKQWGGSNFLTLIFLGFVIKKGEYYLNFFEWVDWEKNGSLRFNSIS